MHALWWQPDLLDVMNIHQLKIVAKTRYVPNWVPNGATTKEDLIIVEQQLAYERLFIFRGKTLGHACDDARYWYQENFMKHVDMLHQGGWIEVNDDRIELHKRPPSSSLEWLARCAD